MALYYHAPVWLQRTVPEVAEDEATADEATSVSSLSLVHDAASLLNTADHYFLDDNVIVGEVGRCLRGLVAYNISGISKFLIYEYFHVKPSFYGLSPGSVHILTLYVATYTGLLELPL